MPQLNWSLFIERDWISKIRDIKEKLEIILILEMLRSQKHNKLLGNKGLKDELLNKKEITLSMKTNCIYF